MCEKLHNIKYYMVRARQEINTRSMGVRVAVGWRD